MKLTEKKATLLMRLFLLLLTAVVGVLFGVMVAKSGGLAGIATLIIGVIWGFNFKKLIAIYKEMWSPKWS